MKKRILVFTLCLALMVSLCACGGGKKLTTDNINEYLSISATVTDCDVSKDSGSIRGIGYSAYDGEATVKIAVVNQSGANFENVKITCEVSTYVDCIPGPHAYGWEFNNGNKQTGTKAHVDKNYKTVTITLPYDGNWSSTEKLTLELYEDGINYISSPYDLSNCYVTITDVSGTVKK